MKLTIYGDPRTKKELCSHSPHTLWNPIRGP